jgi:hypothetical protein
MKELVDELNDKSEFGSQLILEFIDPGLTSVYQPGDVSLNRSLKSKICSSYSKHLMSTRPGNVVKTSREDVVKFVEQSFDAINDEQKRTHSIAKAFRLCGLDPWCGIDEFTAHLDNLSENKIYESLNKHRKAALLGDAEELKREMKDDGEGWTLKDRS